MPFMMKRAGLLAAGLALGACAELTSFGSSSAQVTTLSMLDGTVIGAAPAGYCFETQASRAGDGFAFLADCEIIAGSGDLLAPNGFIRLQVGDAGSGLGDDADNLVALLDSDAGQALLSQTGTADQIRVQSVAARQGGVTVRFIDRAAPPIAGLQQTEWRGFFDVNGRLATVAVRGLDAAPLGTDDGQALLQSAMQAMQRANVAAEIGTDS